MSEHNYKDLMGHDSIQGCTTVGIRPQLEKPRMYKVVLMNDDFTPMDYVIQVLTGFFGMNQARATQVMLQVHYQGKGICGVYSRDVAETKVAQVTQHARSQNYPLLCMMEAQ